MTYRDKILRSVFNGLLSFLLLSFSIYSLLENRDISIKNTIELLLYLLLGILFAFFTFINIRDIRKHKYGLNIK